MEQSPSRKTNSRSASQEIPLLLQNPSNHYSVLMSGPLDRVLSISILFSHYNSEVGLVSLAFGQSLVLFLTQAMDIWLKFLVFFLSSSIHIPGLSLVYGRTLSFQIQSSSQCSIFLSRDLYHV
jgi:hypothetical protein